MPVLPGITDRPRDLELLVQRVAESGATHFVAGSLRLRSTARERYLPVIAAEFPNLLERYQRTFRNGHELAPSYREGLRNFVATLCARHRIARTARDLDDELPGADHSGEGIPAEQLYLPMRELTATVA